MIMLCSHEMRYDLRGDELLPFSESFSESQHLTNKWKEKSLGEHILISL
jgi:hypothetical protein